ncbi:cytochrome P450 [Penicillium atrosanguineum]|uniref:Uncharacterized protein n=1 Tax=Penicillium atrosanguineum TaxID=1132637 RepID=A0A9W9PLK6_9EURO|nr:cytochrome P450 [Penicillium atrosanguineum]KAJ5296533.1 cytochrome P450 [Penicillium atrosanguineum]KAJ5299296.1 hypothetical protein N7476_010853 [Penicillium atrosanguineum]
MLAPGPAGTTMIGESNIEAAARRGLEKQRQHDNAMKFSNKIPSTDTNANTSNKTLPTYKSSTEDESQEQPQSLKDQRKRNGQAPSQPESKDPSKLDSIEGSSQEPAQSQSGLRSKWQRVCRRFHAKNILKHP